MAKLLEHSPWGGPDLIFDELAGRWQIERRIDNGAVLTGTAIFKRAASNELRYCEEGRLRLPNGGQFDSEQKYVYGKLEGGFAVFFNETPLRLFHELHFQPDGRGAFRGHATHPCDNDLYNSEYAFLPDGSFVVQHQVTGPKKSYLMITQYHRIAPIRERYRHFSTVACT